MPVILPVPAKSLLSWAFALVTGEDRLYSRIHKKTGTVLVGEEFDDSQIAGTMQKSFYRWAEATPLQGNPGLYTVSAHEYHRNHELAVSGNRHHEERRMRETGTGRSTFTRSEAGNIIAQMESQWAKEGFAVEKAQPFRWKMALLQGR